MTATLYFVTGTHTVADALGRGVLPLGADPAGSFLPLIDSTVWNPVSIDYAASFFPLWASGAQGVSRLVAQITATPGRFALAGLSQGAWVISRVYAEIAGGSLQSRATDFVSGVTWGSPMRATNHTYPGQMLSGAFDVDGSTSGGHGCISTRMTSIPQQWWDFANSLDPITSVGDSPEGRLWVAFCDWFSGHYISGDIVTLAFQELGTLFTHPAAITNLLSDVARDIGSAQGHNYLVPAPGAPAGSPSMMQLGADYLNSLGKADAYSAPAWAVLPAGVPAPPPPT